MQIWLQLPIKRCKFIPPPQIKMGSSFSIVNDTNTDIFVYESPSAELLEAMGNPFVIVNPFDPKNQPTRHLPPGQTYSSGKIKGVQVPKTVLLENGFNKERKSRLCWTGPTNDSNTRWSSETKTGKITRFLETNAKSAQTRYIGNEKIVFLLDELASFRTIMDTVHWIVNNQSNEDCFKYSFFFVWLPWQYQ